MWLFARTQNLWQATRSCWQCTTCILVACGVYTSESVAVMLTTSFIVGRPQLIIPSSEEVGTGFTAICGKTFAIEFPAIFVLKFRTPTECLTRFLTPPQSPLWNSSLGEKWEKGVCPLPLLVHLMNAPKISHRRKRRTPVRESLPIPFSQAAPTIVFRAWKEEQVRKNHWR